MIMIDRLKKQFVFRQPIKDKTRQEIKFIAEMILNEVREEAKRAGQLFSAVPKTQEFIYSFGVQIKDNGDIVLYSTWQHIKYHLRNKPAYPMTWLKTERNRPRQAIPIKNKNGEIEFRTLPLVTDKSWIHPAVVKFSWIEKAIDRAVIQATTILTYEKMTGQELLDRKKIMLQSKRKQARFKALTTRSIKNGGQDNR
jgi:hypothetical protein